MVWSLRGCEFRICLRIHVLDVSNTILKVAWSIPPFHLDAGLLLRKLK